MDTVFSLLYVIVSPIHFLITMLISLLVSIVKIEWLRVTMVLFFFSVPLILARYFFNLNFGLRVLFSILGYILLLSTIIIVGSNLKGKNTGNILLTILWGAMIGIWL